MIECKPMGICSWDYGLAGEGHRAELRFRFARESGEMRVDGVDYEIRKGGWLSGAWELRRGDEGVAQAEKRSAWTRSFDLTCGQERYTLTAASMMGRTMELEGEGLRAVIAPAHAFTRRASIEGDLPDFALTCFGFWLTVLLWRRADDDAATAANPVVGG